MARTSGAAPEPRMHLSRERVLQAAIAIADEDGVDAVTIRRLATELGVKPMSIYHHVANKDEILAGMVDLVFSEIGLPEGDEGWRGVMRQRALSARGVLARHRWAVGLLESRKAPGPATLQHHDAVIGTFRRAGFSIEMAAHAYSVLDSYVYGFALQEVQLPFESSEDVEGLAREMLAHLAADEYPHLTEMIVEHALKPGYDYAHEYEFGLDLILDGLEQFLEASQT